MRRTAAEREALGMRALVSEWLPLPRFLEPVIARGTAGRVRDPQRILGSESRESDGPSEPPAVCVCIRANGVWA
jgi:hypothetical protein